MRLHLEWWEQGLRRWIEHLGGAGPSLNPKTSTPPWRGGARTSEGMRRGWWRVNERTRVGVRWAAVEVAEGRGGGREGILVASRKGGAVYNG